MTSDKPERDDQHPKGVDWTRYEDELNNDQADVLDFDTARTRRGGGPTTSDSHFDVPLDDEPSPGGVLVDAPPTTAAGRRAIIPVRLRGWQNLKATMRDITLDVLHRA